jgi:hypothetical protein
VIKFFNGDYKGWQIDQELSIWHDIWKFVVVRRITLCKKNAILLPLLHCFESFQAVVDGFQFPEKKVRASVRDAARQLANKHYYHGDLKWKHVGFSVEKEGSSFAVVFIDLIGVKKIEARYDRYAELEMYRCLELLLDNEIEESQNLQKFYGDILNSPASQKSPEFTPTKLRVRSK